MAPKGPVEFLSRRDRSRRFGFDCPSLIYFKDWTPGGEYSVRPLFYLSLPTFKLPSLDLVNVQRELMILWVNDIIINYGFVRFTLLLFRSSFKGYFLIQTFWPSPSDLKTLAAKYNCQEYRKKDSRSQVCLTQPHPSNHTDWFTFLWDSILRFLKLWIRLIYSLRNRYVLPESKYFSMAFPEPIRLAAGNSVNCKVVFRPVVSVLTSYRISPVVMIARKMQWEPTLSYHT